MCYSLVIKLNIRAVYLYLLSFIGLVLIIFGSVQLLDLGLKQYVFRVSEYESFPEYPKLEGEQVVSREELVRSQEQAERNQRRRSASHALSMIIVGVPIYLYHWRELKKSS